MFIRDYFEWNTQFGGDAEIDVFAGNVDPRKVDWDLAIWGNITFATWARAHKANKSSVSVVPLSGQQWLSNPDVFSSVISRVPYTEVRCAQTLVLGSEHIVKAMNKGDAGSGVWTVYDPVSGVWLGEKDKGEVYGVILRVLSNDFGEAMNRAVDLAEHFLSFIPRPTKPSANASAADKNAYEKANAVVKAMEAKIKRLRKFEDSLRGVRVSDSILSKWKSLVTEDQAAWDSDMRWIVLRDCALDLDSIVESKGDSRAEFIVEHSPAHMSTMALDVSWSEYAMNSDVEDSEWYRGVARALPDPDIRKYLQKRFGGALLGRPGSVSKSLVWQYGPSGAAKSTIQEIIAGSDGVLAPYAYVASSSVLTEKGARTGSTERFKAYARGKRIILMDELRRGSSILEDELKTLTGGNTVEGTAKYSNSVSYNFTATIFVASNDAPTVASGDKIAMNRIHVVPFEHVFYLRDDNPEAWANAPEEHRADPGWKARVLGSHKERAAVLTWVLNGLFLFVREGIGELPEAMKEARDEFQEDGKGLADRLLDYLLTGGEYDNPWIRVYSDEEWDAAGLRERDGITVDRVKSLLAMAGSVSGLTNGTISAGLENNVLANLNQMGGKRKRIAGENGKRPYAFTRVREEMSVTSRFGSIQV